MNNQDVLNKDKYYINPETREVIKKFDPKDVKVWVEARHLAFLSFSLEITSDVLFLIGCVFYLVQIIVSTSSTHNASAAIRDAYINDTKNFWPVILGGVLFGIGIILKVTKYILQLRLVPLVRQLIQYAPYDSLNYALKKYDAWKTGTTAFLVSFNLIMGWNCDRWVLKFCKENQNKIELALKTNPLH